MTNMSADHPPETTPAASREALKDYAQHKSDCLRWGPVWEWPRHLHPEIACSCGLADVLAALQPSAPAVTTIKPADCTHPDFGASVVVGRIEDVGKFVAEVRVQCTACGEPFRFVGVPAGLSYEEPMVSMDGLELRAPIEPEIETRLHTKATFFVTPIPVKH